MSEFLPPPGMRSLIRDEPKRHPATAHFPIEDSPHTCRGCANFIKGSRKRGRCELWAIFYGKGAIVAEDNRRDQPDWWRGLPTISRDCQACKYFEARP